ncbi:MAG: Uncharacterised protein [Flavobacterium sp. SCGC AAA160-P02]|nr:MAG: Uncharacterised protein [Flavobacterium sp. SCGC AAA160-P02]|tara:strand:+ start:1792 stop:2295 length:504 start_codon:yes stop_codon:yes gene_type:complete
MKKLILITIASFFILSCNNDTKDLLKKSEFHLGVIEGNDSKSTIVNSFNDAYLANDMSGQNYFFSENATGRVNGQKMSPSQMIEAFMSGREFYTDIKNKNRATGTFILDNGQVFTNTWFEWEGTSKSTGVKVSNPVHASFKWEGDKVVEVTYVFDSAEYVANMGQEN